MTTPNNESLNWIDPDILAFNDGTHASYDLEKEKEFKEFFTHGWLDPAYDDIRTKWDKQLNDPSAHARVLAKTALWSLVQLRELQKKIQR